MGIEGVTFSEVAHVKGMENPGDAMRNAIRWLVKHGDSDDAVRKVAGANALRVLRDTWIR
jgi:membrane dipeptidase